MWQPPKYTISQAATSQEYPIHSAVDSQCILWRLRRPNLTFGKHNAWEVALWEIVTWEVAIWEIITWDHCIPKFPSIYIIKKKGSDGQ